MADLPHFESSSATAGPHDGPWHSGMTRYHWFVLIVAALGWLFDCLDQQLFNLARKPAMQTLLATADAAADPKAVDFYGGLSTCIFMLGWATGGLIFGVVGDRLGRAKTMMITIVIYSLCTGLSALSQGFWDFAFYRFITGLGVGGEFAVGVALVTEVAPRRGGAAQARGRPQADALSSHAPPAVRLGDASMAAPFTSRRASVASCVQVREWGQWRCYAFLTHACRSPGRAGRRW